MGFKKKDKVEEPEKTEVKRVIPIDKNNEQFLIGHALNNSQWAEQLVSEVDKDTFLYANHKAIFRCMQYLSGQGIDITPDSIESVKKQFDGGMSVRIKYLGEIKSTFKELITDNSYRFHIRKLKNDRVKDSLMMRLLPDLGQMLINPKFDIVDIQKEVETILTNIESNCSDADFLFSDASEAKVERDAERKAREDGTAFVSTGYKKLDNLLTDGFGAGKMSIIAGRTGMGKSALLANIYLRLAMLGVPVALYNFEMGTVSMLDRLISIKANIPLLKLIRKRELLTEEELADEKEAENYIATLPIYFYGSSTQTLEGIKRELKILKERYGIRVVAYDLFDKIKFNYRRGGNDASVINDALKQVQGYSRDFDLHQILIVQIGRSAEKRKNKRPKLSELKDAGGYEERSDNIFFLYRPEYYEMAEEEMELDETSLEEIEVIIAKQRQGVANTKVILNFFPVTTTIAEPTIGDDDGVDG